MCMVQEVMITLFTVIVGYNIICAQIMRAIFLLAAHASIIYTLSDPQWRASRADMWVRPVDRTSPQRRNRQSAAQSNDNTSQHHEHRQHTNNAHKRPRERLPGPWAARSSVVGRWAGGRAATLLLATPWPLRAALGPHQRMNEKAADCTKSSTAIAPVPRGRGINGVHVNKYVSAACGNF